MMRLNPRTGKRFYKGDKRDDGWVFNCYLGSTLPDGYYREVWIMPTPKAKPSSKPLNKLGYQMTKLLGGARSHAKARKHSVPEITKQDLLNQWHKQSGKCAYTGWDMSLETGSKLIVSLERRDNSVNYTKDNIILVCWVANCAKNTLTLDQFIQLCGAVVVHTSNLSGDQLLTTMGAQCD